MITTVYLVHHVKADDEHREQAKFIGAYSSQRAAEEAVARLCGKPGFVDHPAGFEINPCKLDADHWTEGFRTDA